MIKKVLLACSNYFPHNFGGTEVYVQSHAAYLLEKKNIVYIVTTVPATYFNEENIIYSDEILKVCRYEHNQITVFGASYQNVMATDLLYSKYEPKYSASWNNFISNQPELTNLDLFHVHSFTPTIGLNLFEAITRYNKKVKIVTSYHTPISCPKGTLMYAKSLMECHVKAGVKICSDCLQKTQDKIPYLIAKTINKLHLTHRKLPSVLKKNHLVELEIHSFNRLKEMTSEWWCYSIGVKNILLINGIQEANIKMARHGIDEMFFSTKIEKASDKMVFVFSGRQVKIKGIITLLSAWLNLPIQEKKQLWLTFQPFSIDKELNKLIQKAIKRDDVVFLGKKSQKELILIYEKAHFIIIPSEWYEIGPLVFHEAIANKCNVICSDIGGCKELAQHYRENAVTFKAGDVKELTQTILSSKYKGTSTLPENFSTHFKIQTGEHIS